MPLPGLRSADFIQARRARMGDRAPEAGQAFRAVAGNPLPYQSDPSPSMTGPLPVARFEGPTGTSTTHLVTCDAQGNRVTYTLTLARGRCRRLNHQGNDPPSRLPLVARLIPLGHQLL
jgi:gamma-glutamyltranspeptidase/glutathione hydrolase